MAKGGPDREAILRDFVYGGQSVESIARSRRLTVAEVTRIVDEEAARRMSGEELRRGLYVEAVRLEALLRRHFAAAMEGDTISAALYVKTSERLSSMIGTNAPIGHAVHVIHSSAKPVEQGTSTQRMLEAIRRLRNEPEPEDEQEPLEDKLN
jgi:hypothetical protein